MSLQRYALRVLVMSAASLAVAWPLLDRVPGAAPAAVFGAGLATLNTLLAFYLVSWSQGRPTNVFLGAVLGGMLGRMGAMLGAVVAGILVLDLPQVPLVISVLSYFTLFLVFELNVVNRTLRSEAHAR